MKVFLSVKRENLREKEPWPCLAGKYSQVIRGEDGSKLVNRYRYINTYRNAFPSSWVMNK